jgi:hypothetical protein
MEGAPQQADELAASQLTQLSVRNMVPTLTSR